MKQRALRILPVLLVTLLCGGLLFGCGKTIQPASDVASAFYNLFISGDSTQAKEMFAFTDADIEDITKVQKQGSIQMTKANIAATGYNATDEEAEKMYDAQMEAFKKLTYTAEVTEEDNKNATVVIKTQYYDIAALDEQAAQEALDEYGEENLTDQAAVEAFVKLYMDKFVTIMGNAAPAEDQTEVTVQFQKANTDVGGKTELMWVPTNASGFGTDLIQAVSGQK